MLGVRQTYEPRRDEVREAERTEHQLWLRKLGLKGQLSGLYLVHFGLDCIDRSLNPRS